MLLAPLELQIYSYWNCDAYQMTPDRARLLKYYVCNVTGTTRGGVNSSEIVVEGKGNWNNVYRESDESEKNLYFLNIVSSEKGPTIECVKGLKIKSISYWVKGTRMQRKNFK